MSIKIMTLVWENFKRGGGEKLVLLALADWGGDDGGRIYPSVKSVAAKTNMSERQVQRILATFVGEGILTITGYEHGGRNKPRHYRMNIEALKGDILSVADSERVTSCPLKGDICDVKGDIAVSPEPLEPLNEPLLPNQPKINGKRRSSLSPDWEIEEDDPCHLYAKSKGMTWAQMEIEEEQFKNHHIAKGNVMVDWQAAWRTWVNNWVKFGKGNYGKTQGR